MILPFRWKSIFGCDRDGPGSVSMKAAPFSGAAALALQKCAAEMALIDETAGERDFSKFHGRIVQKLLGAFDAPHQKPRMRGRSSGLPERPREIAARQAAQ